MWALSHRLISLGLPAAASPVKPQPASTAGSAPSSLPRLSCPSVVVPHAHVQPPHKKKKVQATDSRYKSNGSSIEVISAPLTWTWIGVCVSPIPSKEAGQANSTQICAHEEGSSKSSVKAREPAPNAITAEILKMLPTPHQHVSIFLGFLTSYIAQDEMCLLHDHEASG